VTSNCNRWRAQAQAMRRFGAWAGMIGSMLFVSVFTIEGLLCRGYDPASMYISALSLGPRGWIQITNFIVVGLLIILFAKGVAAEFGVTAHIGVTLLMLIGISLVASGLFVMDPATVPFFQMSAHSDLHYLFGALVFSLAPASCFVFFTRFSRVSAWRAFGWWTLRDSDSHGRGDWFPQDRRALSSIQCAPPVARRHSTRDHRSFLHLGVHLWSGDAQALSLNPEPPPRDLPKYAKVSRAHILAGCGKTT
jgi:hypothetical protein